MEAGQGMTAMDWVERAQKYVEEIVRLTKENAVLKAELVEAHNWLSAEGICGCEYFEGMSSKPCRFREALDG